MLLVDKSLSDKRVQAYKLVCGASTFTETTLCGRERNKIITPTQSGFRKGRSTTDQLVRLESFVREAFIQKQHTTAIFFDLEKAYDTTWKFGILKDLHDTGLQGRLPLFIASFLSDRKFQFRVAGSYSKLCEQETEVPHGSILSVTLFCLKINSIIKAVCPGVDYRKNSNIIRTLVQYAPQTLMGKSWENVSLAV